MSTTTGGCQRGCPVLLRLGPLPQDIKAQPSYKDLHAYVCVLLEGSWGGAFCLLSLLGLLLLGRNRSREKAGCVLPPASLSGYVTTSDFTGPHPQHVAQGRCYQDLGCFGQKTRFLFITPYWMAGIPQGKSRLSCQHSAVPVLRLGVEG